MTLCENVRGSSAWHPPGNTKLCVLAFLPEPAIVNLPFSVLASLKMAAPLKNKKKSRNGKSQWRCGRSISTHQLDGPQVLVPGGRALAEEGMRGCISREDALCFSGNGEQSFRGGTESENKWHIGELTGTVLRKQGQSGLYRKHETDQVLHQK